MSLNLAIIGPGLVGKEFIRQVLAFKHPRVSLNVIGVINSKKMKLEQISRFSDDLFAGAIDADMDNFIKYCGTHLPCIVVDCTSSEYVAKLYPEILEKMSIVTPNKKAFSSSLELYNSIRKAADSNRTFCLHESTVGAGLPILSTLNDLVLSGDKVELIQGVFSGTLSYLFNEFTNADSFSAIVKKAKELGYTEPDPRDDLNGVDVGRKVVILARLIGLQLDLSTLSVENIVPEKLQSITSVEEFMSKLPAYDSHFSNLKQKASANGCVLRYVGTINPSNPSECSVDLKMFPKDHPFGALKGSDNLVSFTTKNFPNPLVIQGAGAGASVTAFGMFSDVLKICQSVVGPL